jgi:diadenosine tetraphosphate (Ap4A) HIT family hydrolase
VSDCFVCQKHRGEIDVPGGAIYEDELVYSSHGVIDAGRATAYLGTLFVEPKRCVPGFGDLTRAEAERVGLVASRLAAALQATEHAEHVYLFVLGAHVPHLHLWLRARYPGTPREFWGLRVAEWPGAPKGGATEIAALCERVRSHLGAAS